MYCTNCKPNSSGKTRWITRILYAVLCAVLVVTIVGFQAEASAPNQYSNKDFGVKLIFNGEEKYFQQGDLSTYIHVDTLDDLTLQFYKNSFWNQPIQTGVKVTLPKGKYEDWPISYGIGHNIVDGWTGKTLMASCPNARCSYTITYYDEWVIKGFIDGVFTNPKGKDAGDFRMEFVSARDVRLLAGNKARTIYCNVYGGDNSGFDSNTGSAGYSGSSSGSKSSSSSGKKTCGVCGGNGKCHICNGKKFVSCSGWSCSSGRCTTCNGSGRVRSLSGSTSRMCSSCTGAGRCSICSGLGKVKCHTCGGDGKCNGCNGKGHH